MLFRSSAVAFALTASLVNAGYINTGSYAPVAAPGSDYASTSPAYSGYASKQGYTNNKSNVLSTFASSQSSIDKYVPIFENSCKSQNTDVVIKGLVDIHASVLALTADLNVGVGIWIAADLNVFVNLYVSLLVKLQVLLNIIHLHAQVDVCSSAIVALTAPLKALLSVFVNAGIDVGAIIGAKVDLNLFVAVGISLGISVNAHVGVGAGIGALPFFGHAL